MKNFNLFFENSVRTELIGYNVSTVTVDLPKKSDTRIWKNPVFSLQGVICLGHMTDKENVLSMHVYENGNELEFESNFHRWTPAWCETVYRNVPQEYYKKSGCIVVREKKCITEDDIFVSELLITNNKTEKTSIKLDFTSVFEKQDDLYKVQAKALADGLCKQFYIDGYFSLFGIEESNDITIYPGKSIKIKYCFAFDNNADKAEKKAKTEYNKRESFLENERNVNNWFYDNVPLLKTDDKDIEKIYYYRFLMLYINTFSPKKVIPEHYIEKQAIYECRYGGWFGCPITLPLPMHISEARWLKKHELVKQQLDIWKSGKLFEGYIEYTPYSAYEYYNQHKDIQWLRGMYESFKKCTLQKYDEKSPLPITQGSWLTGAEYQPSFYQWTEPEWDWRCDEEGRTGGFLPNKLYRLDEIMFFAANLKACSNMALELEKQDESDCFLEILDKVICEIKEKFWDEKTGMFYDVDVRTGKRCDKAACYDSFAPFLYGLIDDEKYEVALDKLFDDAWFYDDVLITSTAKNCPMYWYDNCLVYGVDISLENPHKYGCCWNGPIWPFAVTVVLNSLGSASKKFESYKEKWIQLFRQFTNLHFSGGNRSVPCILEHYRPGDGVTFSPCVDYFHSSWIDLFMKYWAGINVEGQEIIFKPFTNDEFELYDVCINGKMYNFKQYIENGNVVRTFEEKNID